MSDRITNSDDVIDSRDIIDRIAELEADLLDAHEASASTLALAEWLEEIAADTTATLQDAAIEYIPLKALADEGENYSPDWTYGATLIRDSYFEQYAEELADDIGAVDRNVGWPNSFIDWEAAADALKQDYTSVDFDGVTYWVR
jgi:hypothetical protein